MYSPCAAPWLTSGFLLLLLAASLMADGHDRRRMDLVVCSAACECDGVFFVRVAQRCIRSGRFFLAVRMAGEQSKYEPREQRGADGKQAVSGNSHPTQGLH